VLATSIYRRLIALHLREEEPAPQEEGTGASTSKETVLVFRPMEDGGLRLVLPQDEAKHVLMVSAVADRVVQVRDGLDLVSA
jgi:hypothetical protein